MILPGIIAGSGGATTPTPLVSADFKNGVYSINGVSKTLGQVCEQNTDWAVFSPSDVANGIGYAPPRDSSYQGPLLTPEAYALLSNGFVAVATFTLSLTPADQAVMATWLFDIAYAHGEYAAAFFGEFVTGQQASVTAGSAGTTGSFGALVSGSNKAAFILDPVGGAAYCSVNGAPSASKTGSDHLTFRDSIGFYFYTNSGGSPQVMESLEFFALSDYGESDLPGLSA